ncbi:MAG: D-alanyl-D-alanine carboxypeptidase [Caulobacteraceae bacterium]
MYKRSFATDSGEPIPLETLLSKSARIVVRAAVLAGVATALAGAPVFASAQAGWPRVPSYEPKYTAIVMDARSGEILYGERADSPRYPASVTKVMTFYLVFEALSSGRLRLNDQVVVSPLAAAQPATKLGLRAGETISVENAMYAMAVHSANDMAVALSERVGGTESRFAEMMTAKAQQLGMLNTRYVNANGLPDSRQISSAHDIAILTRAILRDFPQYYRFFSQEQFTWRGKTMFNTNHLLGKMPGVDGLKTGFTNAAGFNLDASATRNGNRLIAVVMGSSSSAVRNANVEGLLLTGFDVMQRRARGERMASTQAYFQPGGASYVTTGRPPLGEGDTSDPIDVVLTRNTVRPTPMTISNAMPAVAPRGREARTWWIQVGEFRSRQEARSRVEDVSRRFVRIFDNAEGAVVADGRGYRARFSGFTSSAAAEACDAVRTRRIPCIAGGA